MRTLDSCHGSAFKYVAQNGLVAEETYPYTAGSGRSGTCQTSKTTDPVAQISSWVQVSCLGKCEKSALFDEDGMVKALLASGPITIGVDASPMQLYRRGVDNPKRCKTAQSGLDHAVLIVGYGTDKGTPYWKVCVQPSPAAPPCA